MRTFIDGLGITTPLEPRDAFLGGRTEAYTLHKETPEDETIDYYDVTSLYPWVNKTGKIPVGHPQIITQNFKSVDEYEGLIKCKVIPPKGCFILFYRVNATVSFCFTYVKPVRRQRSKNLAHTDNDRSFIGH
jgi:hypothetical protein